MITEAADSLNEFYRKLYSHLTQEDIFSGLKKLTTKAQQSIKKIKIEEIGTKGVKFAAAEINYLEEFTRLIRNLELDRKIVLMIDEFPQTLENILEYKSKQEAIQLLQTQRELRIDPEIKKKLLFIYVGSIGLENVVSRIDSTKHINDLAKVTLPALTREQALEFIDETFTDHQLAKCPDVISYLFDSIEWLIPFYLRAVVEELPTTDLTTAHVDTAIDELLECRNHFEHWHSRLRTALNKDEYLFAKALLNLASTPKKQHISSAEITDLAVQHKVLDHQTEVMGMLKHDGYLNNHENPQEYSFNSPIVRLWWWRNIAN